VPSYAIHLRECVTCACELGVWMRRVGIAPRSLCAQAAVVSTRRVSRMNDSRIYTYLYVSLSAGAYKCLYICVFMYSNMCAYVFTHTFTARR